MFKIKLAFSALFLSLFFSPILAQAAQVALKSDYLLAESETVVNNFYLIAEKASLLGRVSRDAVFLAGNLESLGRLSGDLLAGAGMAQISSEVLGDFRFVGGNLQVSGRVNGEFLAAAGELQVKPEARIMGEARMAAGRLVIDGELGGALYAAGGEVVLNGRIKGPVSVWAERLVLGPKAEILGDLTYQSPLKAEINEGAVVRGKTTFQTVNESPVFSRESLTTFFSSWRLAMLLGSILLIFVLFKFLPQLIGGVVTRVFSRPFVSLLFGLGTIILLPFLTVLLFVSVIGWPLGAMFLLTFSGLLLLARVLAGVLLGVWLFRLVRREGEPELSWQALLAGPSLLFVISHVPVLGNLALAATFFLTLGALSQLIWYKLVRKTQ